MDAGTALVRMKELAKDWDTSGAHVAADRLLIDIIKSFAKDSPAEAVWLELCATFTKMKKWYE